MGLFSFAESRTQPSKPHSALIKMSEQTPREADVNRVNEGLARPQEKRDLAQPWRAFFKNVTDGRVEPEWVKGVKPTGSIRLRHEYDDKHLGG